MGTATDAIISNPTKFSNEQVALRNTYNLHVVAYDGSGSINCKLSHLTAEKILCNIEKFEKMDDEEKRSLRWAYLMTPVKLSIKYSFQIKSLVVVKCTKITLNEMKAKVVSTEQQLKKQG